jgi:hypothetical protein
MITGHLSEEEMQQAALEPVATAPLLLDHLQICSHCRVRVRNYQLLFTQLQTSLKPTFDLDLASLVLAKINPPEAVVLESDWFDYVLGFLIASGSISVLYFFWKSLWATLLGDSLMIVGLLLLTVAIIFGFQLLEQLRSHQRKMKTLSFY